ncbi:MAG: hypothetical protein M1838_004636 [Thelocarpon superellum]|nr:MAG: hypothetical protein M1838_004636 [Thelocarpon superellum]
MKSAIAVSVLAALATSVLADDQPFTMAVANSSNPSLVGKSIEASGGHLVLGGAPSVGCYSDDRADACAKENRTVFDFDTSSGVIVLDHYGTSVQYVQILSDATLIYSPAHTNTYEGSITSFEYTPASSASSTGTLGLKDDKVQNTMSNGFDACQVNDIFILVANNPTNKLATSGPCFHVAISTSDSSPSNAFQYN